MRINVGLETDFYFSVALNDVISAFACRAEQFTPSEFNKTCLDCLSLVSPIAISKLGYLSADTDSHFEGICAKRL